MSGQAFYPKGTPTGPTCPPVITYPAPLLRHVLPILPASAPIKQRWSLDLHHAGKHPSPVTMTVRIHMHPGRRGCPRVNCLDAAQHPLQHSRPSCQSDQHLAPSPCCFCSVCPHTTIFSGNDKGLIFDGGQASFESQPSLTCKMAELYWSVAQNGLFYV